MYLLDPGHLSIIFVAQALDIRHSQTLCNQKYEINLLLNLFVLLTIILKLNSSILS